MSDVTDKKTQIFNQAARLFREKGYPSTTMRELARAVELEPSSLYSHISSKDEILEEICLGLADRFMNGIQRILDRNHSLKEAMGAIIDLHIRLASENPVAFAVFQDEWRHLPPDSLSAFKDKRKIYEKRIIELFQRDRNHFSMREIDPGMATYTLLNALRWIHHVDALDRKDQQRKLSQSIKQLFLHDLPH